MSRLVPSDGSPRSSARLVPSNPLEGRSRVRLAKAAAIVGAALALAPPSLVTAAGQTLLTGSSNASAPPAGAQASVQVTLGGLGDAWGPPATATSQLVLSHTLPTDHPGLLAWYSSLSADDSTIVEATSKPALTDWTPTNVSVIANQPDPWGGTTASLVKEGATSAQHLLTATWNGTRQSAGDV